MSSKVTNKEEFFNHFYIAVTLLVITTIVISYIYWLFNKQTISVSEIKDIFLALIGIFTPYFAILLFADWKEQHNLKIHSDSAKEILKLYEEAFYKLLKLDDFYHEAQFDLKKIILNEPQGSQQNSALQVYQKLEKSINTELLEVEEKLDWILFKTTTLAIIMNEPSLLQITVDTKKQVSNLMQPIRNQTNNTVSSREFDQFYKNICDNSIHLAHNSVKQIVLVLKKYIEA